MDKSKDPKNPMIKTEDREAVTFGDALVDSVYVKAPEHVELEVGTGAHSNKGVRPGMGFIAVLLLTVTASDAVSQCIGDARTS
jgi:hypothetical protein